jgi:methyl-accepting chemotaxis protein
MFQDKTGMAAAHNRTPLLIQSYRRDIGGGKYQLMVDASAPIMVKGRHWGALRVGYKIG